MTADGTVADPVGSGLWEDIAGSVAVVDTEVAYDTYSGSIGEYVTDTRVGVFWNAEATGLFASGDHAYLLVNCGIVSLLATKANGGLTVRVTGATATDWAEFELFGSDEWPSAFDGGWIQIVVDIDELLLNPTNTNGTPPTVGNIQRFGITAITASVMPRMADNLWVGGFAILGANTPAIIVEGRSGGSVDWTWDLIKAVAAVKLSAVIKAGPGGSCVSRGPIQFGINDTTTHQFTEKNKTLLWDDQELVLDGFYSLSALGNSGGTTDVVFGIKTGTGDDATGSQGGSIQSASTGPRFNFDFDDANLDNINLYGVTIQRGGDLQIDAASSHFISCVLLDCASMRVDNAGDFLRNSIVNAGTADGVAFITTDDLTDIKFCAFEFSDGHAVELTTPIVASQASKGNTFTGYGITTSNDAAIYNNAAGAVTINVSDGGSSPTYRNGTSATTTVNAVVSLVVTVVDEAGAAIPYATVSIQKQSDNSEESAGTANNLGVYTDSTYNYTADTDVNIVVRSSSPGAPRYKEVITPNTIINTGMTAGVALAAQPFAGLVPMRGLMTHGVFTEAVNDTVIATTIYIPTTGTFRRLVVAVMHWDASSNLGAPSAATYDGNAMTAITGATQNVVEGANHHQIRAYRYSVPDTDSGSKTISITLASAVTIKGLAFVLLEDAQSVEVDASTTSGSAVTTNPTANVTNDSNPDAWSMLFCITDDLDAPTPTGVAGNRIRRADLMRDGLLNQIVVTAVDRTGAGEHSVGADFGSNSKSWVGAVICFEDE